MSFLILLCLNALFGACVFLYFRERFKKLVEADEIRRELGAVIQAFNQQADAQITLLEDLLKQSRQSRDELELQLAEWKRLSVYGGAGVRGAPVERESRPEPKIEAAPPPAPRGKARPAESPMVEPAAPATEPPPELVEKEYLVTLDEEAEREKMAEERLVAYLKRKEQERYERFTVPEKVRFLSRQKGESPLHIARSLGISLSEIELILRKSIPGKS